MLTKQQIAEAFSGHRFTETYGYLAPDVRWVSVGAGAVNGRAAVIDLCERSATELSNVNTIFLRSVSVVGPDAVAIDAIGRYTDADQTVSVVSSCDIYEFRDDQVVMITSYTVELDPQSV
jgi:limonene-1,2-epoxide hydrolase